MRRVVRWDTGRDAAITPPRRRAHLATGAAIASKGAEEDAVRSGQDDAPRLKPLRREESRVPAVDDGGGEPVG